MVLNRIIACIPFPPYTYKQVPTVDPRMWQFMLYECFFSIFLSSPQSVSTSRSLHPSLCFNLIKPPFSLLPEMLNPIFCPSLLFKAFGVSMGLLCKFVYCYRPFSICCLHSWCSGDCFMGFPACLQIMTSQCIQICQIATDLCVQYREYPSFFWVPHLRDNVDNPCTEASDVSREELLGCVTRVCSSMPKYQGKQEHT